MMPEELGKSFFWHISACHLENDPDQLFVGCIEFIPVQLQKDKCGHRTGTFIPIHKRMVLDKMKEVCSRHIRNGRMEIVSTE